ncbi:YveK family protein [Paenisporosarcina sp. NPDC076898]|uniref:YveK family protein n=1 Tax=unclassified Paenisporosarcina TaxID=2642018 RepID=UPI003D02E388
MEETISLQELFHTLKKRIVLILTLTILATLISGIVSYFFVTPIYQASTQLLVNQEKSETPILNVSDIQTNLQLINTYNVIIKSPAILDIVRKDLALDTLTTEGLNSKITVSAVGESQVLTITVQDPDQFVARDIANTTASVFQREISNIMNVDNVSILSQATATDTQSPIKPNKPLNMAIAMVVGLMLGVGLAFLLEYLDTTIKSEQQIEKLLDIPVIGAISSMERKEQSKLDKFQQTRPQEGETL